MKLTAEDLTLFREYYNLSQRELGEILGYSQGYINMIEKKRRVVPNFINIVLELDKEKIELMKAFLETRDDNLAKKRGM